MLTQHNPALQARNAFCAVRPPGHHAGPTGVVPSEQDPAGSHGFCLLNNVAIGGAYAVNAYRNAGASTALPERSCFQVLSVPARACVYQPSTARNCCLCVLLAWLATDRQNR